MRPPACGVGPLVKVILKSLSLAEVCTSRWQEHFSLSPLIFPCLPRILLLPLGFSFTLCSFFFPFFHLHAFSLSVRSYTYARQHRERFRSRSLESRGHRISNVKYAFETKKQVFGFTFRLMDLIRRQTDESKENRCITLSFLLDKNETDQKKRS